jgi:hypothetical protein
MSVRYLTSRDQAPQRYQQLGRQRHDQVVLRAPLGPSVRMRYHRASALSFWNIRKRHANWISPRRTRALPPDAARRVGGGAQGSRAMPLKLDAERGLLRRDAAALTLSGWVRVWIMT